MSISELIYNFILWHPAFTLNTKYFSGEVIQASVTSLNARYEKKNRHHKKNLTELQRASIGKGEILNGSQLILPNNPSQLSITAWNSAYACSCDKRFSAPSVPSCRNSDNRNFISNPTMLIHAMISQFSVSHMVLQTSSFYGALSNRIAGILCFYQLHYWMKF